MNISLPEVIATKWFAAFNAHDLDKLLNLYDVDATHYSPKLKLRTPKTNGLIKGKEALRKWWQDSFERLPDLHYQPIQFTANNNRIFMEYIRQVPGEDDLLVAELLEIKNELIIASKVYHG